MDVGRFLKGAGAPLVGMLVLCVGYLARSPVGAAATPDSVRAFYEGKTVTIIVGTTAGGAFDTYARTLARHIGKHIPGNPLVIVQNMPGAGGLVAANHLYNVAPRDGTVLGTLHPNNVLSQLLGGSGIHFDAARFNWAGSMTESTAVCHARVDAGFRTFEDTFHRTLRVGGAGASTSLEIHPALLNGLLGTRFDIIRGYNGAAAVALAVERNEVQGECGVGWQTIKAARSHWIANRFITILVQLGLAKHPELPDVPTVFEFVPNQETEEILRVAFSPLAIFHPFLLPPDVPQERVQALRRAFDQTLSDPGFLKDAEVANLELTNPRSGEEVQDIVVNVTRAPRNYIDVLGRYIPH